MDEMRLDSKVYKVKVTGRSLPSKPSGFSIKRALHTKFPKRVRRGSVAKIHEALKTKVEATKAPRIAKQMVPLKPRKFNRRAMVSISNVARAEAPWSQMVQKEKVDLQVLIGDLYTALVVQAYKEGEAEVTQQIRGQRNKEVRAMIQKEWDKVVLGNYQSALKMAGVVATPSDFKRMSRELTANRASYQTFLDMRAKGVSVTGSTGKPTRPGKAELLPTLDEGPIDNIQRRIILEYVIEKCPLDQEGVVTKYFSKDFTLRTTIEYPCGVKWCKKKKWGIPYMSACGVKWCKNTITIASGSVSFNLDAGYRINCCGASAWGSVEAKACGSIAGASLCASCNAYVAAVAGVGGVQASGGRCAYGLGLTIGAICKIGGYTVFAGNWAWPWVVEGPCPPFNLCGNRAAI